MKFWHIWIAYLGLVYTMSDHFLCRITCVYTKPGNQHSDRISCPNNFTTSTIFVVFFTYLPSNQSTSFALKPSYHRSRFWERLVSDYDVYQRNKTVQIVPDPFSYHLLINADQSCTGIVGAERVGSIQSHINTTSIRYAQGSDT